MTDRNNSEEGPSLAELADKSLGKIQRYAESDDPKERLIALNSFVFIIGLGLLLTTWLFTGTDFSSIEFFAHLAISLFIAIVLGLGYFRLIETVAGFSDEQASGLRISIILELVAIPLALAGLLFRINILTSSAFLVLAVQPFTTLAGRFVNLPQTKTTEENQSQIWKGLGRTADLITVASFLANLIIITIRMIR